MIATKKEGHASDVTNKVARFIQHSKDTNFDAKKVINLSAAAFEDGDLLSDEPKKSLQEFEHLRITKEKDIPASKPLAFVGESPILAPGNITPVTAEGKAGKTATTTTFLAGASTKIGNADLFTGLKIEPNKEGKAVIHFDTEQEENDQQYNIKTVLNKAGLNRTPDYLLSYNIRTLPLGEYQTFVNDVCEVASNEFGGVYLIVVDGAADFITSVNDEAEANAIISYFTVLAVKYHCPVLLVIHLNENAGRNGDTMPRGHIGRQAVRKGYCQLNITKEGDISTLQVLRARKAGNDTSLICFKYDKEKGYHISVDPDEVKLQRQSEKDESKRRYFEEMAKRIFAPPTALRQTDAVNAIMKDTNKQHSTGKTYLNNMVGWDIVCKGDDGLYRLKL
jgi:hypothetical protein